MTATLIIIAVSLLLLVAAHLFAALRFRRYARQLADRLASAGPRSGTASEGVGDIPPIVTSFAGRAGAATNHPPRVVRLRQAAEMRMAPDKPWSRLECEQAIAITQPGFVWYARQPLGPATMFNVTDAFVHGHGVLKARLFGSVPVANYSGPEADRSELMRYLAELPWAPDAMRHNPSLSWRQLDAHAVEVAADSAGGRACVRLIFNDAGDIAEIQADDRPAVEKGTVVLRAWRGYFSDYGEMGGRRIPRRGEVGYLYDDGYAAYWRGRVTGYRIA